MKYISILPKDWSPIKLTYWIGGLWYLKYLSIFLNLSNGFSLVYRLKVWYQPTLKAKLSPLRIPFYRWQQHRTVQTTLNLTLNQSYLVTSLKTLAPFSWVFEKKLKFKLSSNFIHIISLWRLWKADYTLFNYLLYTLTLVKIDLLRKSNTTFLKKSLQPDNVLSRTTLWA